MKSMGSIDYFYDGAGQRVWKTGPTGAIYIYDAFGQLAAEYNQSTAVTPAPCATCYLGRDHLGSLRLVTDASANVIARHDFAPFGEEIPSGVGGRTALWGAIDDVSQRFTGQVRDTETNLDFFNARYLSSGLGRFTSTDPYNAGADPGNPQTWNGYGYAQGDPLGLVDPSGMCDVAIYGITMNPGDSSVVSAFSAGRVAVFPYAGTNVLTGVSAVIGGGGDVPAAVRGIRSAISQTPTGEQVNIFTISGAAQMLASAWGQLTPGEQARIGNITYIIPGSRTGFLSFKGTLPKGGNDSALIVSNPNSEIPSGLPKGRYNVYWALSCAHDPDCVIRTEQALLNERSGASCPNTQAQPQPGRGSASSTIRYGSAVGGTTNSGPSLGWDEFDLLNLLQGGWTAAGPEPTLTLSYQHP